MALNHAESQEIVIRPPAGKGFRMSAADHHDFMGHYFTKKLPVTAHTDNLISGRELQTLDARALPL